VQGSVVICTRDRRRPLLRCLDSIVRSASDPRSGPVEILVVDDGSQDGTAAAVTALAAQSNVPIRLLRQARLGLSAARNAGVADAVGDVVVFVDDDCVVSPTYLPEMFERFAADAQPVLRGGRVELGNLDDAPLTIRTETGRERLARGMNPGGFILGCNMAMSRAVLKRVGTFDERFGAGSPLRSAEDTDFLLRAFLAGVAVEYDGDAMTVFHHHGRRSAVDIRKAHRAYNIGNGALMAKHVAQAPWLLRRGYWNLRNAVRELGGGPRFDVNLGLSHGPIVWHTILGAALFIAMKARGASSRPQAGPRVKRGRHAQLDGAALARTERGLSP